MIFFFIHNNVNLPIFTQLHDYIVFIFSIFKITKENLMFIENKLN